jgi:hypothetical protein
LRLRKIGGNHVPGSGREGSSGSGEPLRPQVRGRLDKPTVGGEYFHARQIGGRRRSGILESVAHSAQAGWKFGADTAISLSMISTVPPEVIAEFRSSAGRRLQSSVRSKANTFVGRSPCSWGAVGSERCGTVDQAQSCDDIMARRVWRISGITANLRRALQPPSSSSHYFARRCLLPGKGHQGSFNGSSEKCDSSYQ